MTPLAMRVARERMLPIKDRTFRDGAGVLGLIGQDMHCFEVSAIIGPVSDAMDAENMWPEIATVLPHTFLPSPVTWLEYAKPGCRVATVLERLGDWFKASVVSGYNDGEAFSIGFCTFRPRSPLEAGDRIEVRPVHLDENKSKMYLAGFNDGVAKVGAKFDMLGPLLREMQPERVAAMQPKDRDAILARLDIAREFAVARCNTLDTQIRQGTDELEMLRAANSLVVSSVLLLDLINTPGLVGLKQHDPHRTFARQFSGLGAGTFPLRSWSEVVVKTATRMAKPGERHSGATFHKCLHFVRSHARHYQNGSVSVIPAHWRGDPALGIKRTRYRVEAPTLSRTTGDVL